MDLTREEYDRIVQAHAPKSPLGKDMLKAFAFGGAICCVGQAVLGLWQSLGLGEKDAATAESITMIFLGALLTGLGVYDRLARHGGGGTLVPITGFANAVASPAMEFRAEGYVTGMAVKMFTVAGPVIVFGTLAGTVYGILLAVFGLA